MGYEKIRIIKELIKDWESQFTVLNPEYVVKVESVIKNIIDVAQSD